MPDNRATPSYPGIMLRAWTHDDGAVLGCTLCGEHVIVFEQSEAVYSETVIEKINEHVVTHPSAVNT